LNGHEWVEREARRKCLTAVEEGNCFVEGSDFAAVNRVAARLHHEDAIGRLRSLCERWIYSTCLCFALTHKEQKRIGFVYQYSVFQLELSRNLLFLRGTTMNEVYQGLTDRTRAPLDLKQVKTIFGFSHRPHKTAKRGRQAVQVVKAVEARSYDLTVFKVKWGNLTLKIYDKGGRVLRIEVVVHNVKDLRSGKILDKLPELLKRMREMLVRFLGTVQAAHVAFLDEGAFEHWSKPTKRGTRRLAGIDLNKARNRHVVDAVVALSTRPGGFTLAQVAEAVQQRAGRSIKAYTSRNAVMIWRNSRARSWSTASRARAATMPIHPAFGPCALSLPCATRSSSRCSLVSYVPLVERPKSWPRSTSTTSGFARSSTEPLKLSASQRLEKLAGERQHAVARASISA
jgi:hypothetical protein